MIPDAFPLGDAGTDIGSLVLLGLAVLGFIWGIVSIIRSNPTDRIADLVRQRDEAKADLEDCERRCRALERTLGKLQNGGK